MMVSIVVNISKANKTENSLKPSGSQYCDKGREEIGKEEERKEEKAENREKIWINEENK